MSKSTNIAIALFLLNAAAAVMVASGVAADWGVQPEPGGDAAIDESEQNAKNLNPGQGSQDTLGGLFTTSANTLRDIVGVVFAAPLMFQNIGAPTWLTTFIFAPMYLVVALDVLYTITGRRL